MKFAEYSKLATENLIQAIETEKEKRIYASFILAEELGETAAEIRKPLYKGNYHEINISDFCMSVENNKFDIVIDYYSPFAKSIVLSGYVGKYQMNLVLSEIDEVAINFP